jgi:hypothetical protein
MTGPSLVDFLRARLDEDEAVARAATPGPWQWWNLEGADMGWADNGPRLETVARGPRYSDGSQGAATTVVSGWGHDAWGTSVEEPDAAHIARHDPARVLADVKAKRAIVEDYRELRRQASAMADGPMGETARNMYAGLTLALRHLASVYADHPDYDATWAP